MFLIWTPAVKQNSELAGTGSPEGQRPTVYILVSSHPCGNQKPGSGHQCLWQALIRLDLPLSTTQRVRLTFQLQSLDASLFFKQKGGCYSTEVLVQEQGGRAYSLSFPLLTHFCRVRGTVYINKYFICFPIHKLDIYRKLLFNCVFFFTFEWEFNIFLWPLSIATYPFYVIIRSLVQRAVTTLRHLISLYSSKCVA